MRLTAVLLVLLLLSFGPAHGAVVTKLTGKRFSAGDIVQLGKAEFTDKVAVKNGVNVTSTQRVKVTVPLQVNCVYINDRPVKGRITVRKRITVDAYARYRYGKCSVTVDGITKSLNATSGTLSSLCSGAAQALGMEFSADLSSELENAFYFKKGGIEFSLGYLNPFNVRYLYSYGFKTWRALKPIYRKSYFSVKTWPITQIQIHYVFDRDFSYYATIRHEYLVPDRSIVTTNGKSFYQKDMSCKEILAEPEVIRLIEEALRNRLATFGSVYEANLQGTYRQEIDGLKTQMAIFEYQYRNLLNTTLRKYSTCLYDNSCRIQLQVKAYNMLAPLNWLYRTNSYSLYVSPTYSKVTLRVSVSDV